MDHKEYATFQFGSDDQREEMKKRAVKVIKYAVKQGFYADWVSYSTRPIIRRPFKDKYGCKHYEDYPE